MKSLTETQTVVGLFNGDVPWTQVPIAQGLSTSIPKLPFPLPANPHSWIPTLHDMVVNPVKGNHFTLFDNIMAKEKKVFVKERFKLPEAVKDEILSLTPDFGYGQFSEVVFYRTYSRVKPDDSMESWNDVVIRVTEGVFSIRKDWYTKNNITWDEDFWNTYSRGFALSMFKMHWLPPGRGLWAMGTDFVYERGSMALNNCGFIEVGDNIGDCCNWIADTLMCGCGDGFHPIRNDEFETYYPQGEYTHVIGDSREEWCSSIQAAIDCHCIPNRPMPIFDYSLIRPAGLPIHGFGGISSGPEPLVKLHQRIEKFFDMYMDLDWYDTVLLKADIINSIGACVVAGNVRRSAEICLGSINDQVFLDLKNYEKYPHRAEFGWLSNNSAMFDVDEDYEQLGQIASRVIKNAEPGILNRRNIKRGRLGKFKDDVRIDKATGCNPCAEQLLEDRELCTLAETLPTRCETINEWYKSCEYATLYASTVTLLPTHREDTNKVMLRNRRIGVGLIDYTGWKHKIGLNQVIKHLRKGYEIVRNINHWAQSDAGVPDSIRVTTTKPSGTVSKLAGRTAGIGHPNFHHTLRRMRIAIDSPMVPLLIEANIPYELDVVSDNTYVFEFPIIQGPSKPASEVSLWEQLSNIVTAQREWSDNSISNTVTFVPKWELAVSRPIKTITGPDFKQFEGKEFKTEIIGDTFNIYVKNEHHEEDDVENALAAHISSIKSLSLLPASNRGCYRQMPEEGLTVEQYQERVSKIGKIDWSKLKNNMANPDKYCTGESCEVPK